MNKSLYYLLGFIVGSIVFICNYYNHPYIALVIAIVTPHLIRFLP